MDSSQVSVISKKMSPYTRKSYSRDLVNQLAGLEEIRNPGKRTEAIRNILNTITLGVYTKWGKERYEDYSDLALNVVMKEIIAWKSHTGTALVLSTLVPAILTQKEVYVDIQLHMDNMYPAYVRNSIVFGLRLTTEISELLPSRFSNNETEIVSVRKGGLIDCVSTIRVYGVRNGDCGDLAASLGVFAARKKIKLKKGLFLKTKYFFIIQLRTDGAKVVVKAKCNKTKPGQEYIKSFIHECIENRLLVNFNIEGKIVRFEIECSDPADAEKVLKSIVMTDPILGHLKSYGRLNRSEETKKELDPKSAYYRIKLGHMHVDKKNIDRELEQRLKQELGCKVDLWDCKAICLLGNTSLKAKMGINKGFYDKVEKELAFHENALLKHVCDFTLFYGAERTLAGQKDLLGTINAAKRPLSWLKTFSVEKGWNESKKANAHFKEELEERELLKCDFAREMAREMAQKLKEKSAVVGDMNVQTLSENVVVLYGRPDKFKADPLQLESFMDILVAGITKNVGTGEYRKNIPLLSVFSRAPRFLVQRDKGFEKHYETVKNGLKEIKDARKTVDVTEDRHAGFCLGCEKVVLNLFVFSLIVAAPVLFLAFGLAWRSVWTIAGAFASTSVILLLYCLCSANIDKRQVSLQAKNLIETDGKRYLKPRAKKELKKRFWVRALRCYLLNMTLIFFWASFSFTVKKFLGGEKIRYIFELVS